MAPKARVLWILVLALWVPSSGCSLVVSYPDRVSEICGNAVDDDLDGRTDCADEDCPASVCAEDCANGRDDDANELVDCADPACDGSCVETGSLCFDTRDNDLDGLTDWRDPRCWSSAAMVDVRDCGSVEGGTWDFPADFGVSWVSSATPRVEVLPSGRSALFAAVGSTDGVRLRSTPTTTGRVADLDARLELAFLPAGGTVSFDLLTPTESLGVAPPIALEVRPDGPGAWRLSAYDAATPMAVAVEATLDAPTDTALLLSVRMRIPGTGTATWQVTDWRGMVVMDLPSFLSVDLFTPAEPLEVLAWPVGSGGLLSARVTRDPLDPCDVSRPPPALTNPAANLHLSAALLPDGSICALVGFGAWFRFSRAADGSYDDAGASLGALPDVGGLRFLDAMFADTESGEIFGVADLRSGAEGLVLARASECGATLEIIGDIRSWPSPRQSEVSGYGPDPTGAGRELLYSVARAAGGYDYVLARSPNGRPGSFTMDTSPLASGDDAVRARRVGNDWVGVSRVTPLRGGGYRERSLGMVLTTLGDATPLETIVPIDTAGAWVSDGSLHSALVFGPPSGTGFDGLWLQLAYARASTHSGVLVSRVSVRDRGEM